jgi:hypothetical protein
MQLRGGRLIIHGLSRKKGMLKQSAASAEQRRSLHVYVLFAFVNGSQPNMKKKNAERFMKQLQQPR